MAPVHESPSSSKIVFGGTSSSSPASPSLRADTNWSFGDPGETSSLQDLIAEGQKRREEHGRAIWRRLPLLPADLSLTTIQSFYSGDLTSGRAWRLKDIYFIELVKRSRFSSPFVNEEIRDPGWGGFKRHADAKDKGGWLSWVNFGSLSMDCRLELWNIFHELDLDKDGHLDTSEWPIASEKAG
jgi:hypothetical protein